MSEIKPFSPAEVESQWVKKFDPLVIQAVNNLLIVRYTPNNKNFIIKQDEIITEIKCLMTEEKLTRAQQDEKVKELFANHQLDIEEFYRKAGWRVIYDKPGYSESYDAFFEFTALTSSHTGKIKSTP